MKHGFLLIDKPSGPTSHDIVAMARKQLQERSIGHLGTLDPLASGLMVLAVGKKALKVVELFQHCDKEYVADVRLGAVSTTYDAQGEIEEIALKPGRSQPTEIDIRNIIDDRFIGKIRQRPPAHSAIRIDGKRAYEAARNGEDIEMPERTVDIAKCSITSFSYPELKLTIACSGGTYIRSLAHDLGQLLHCGGYLTALRRTKVKHWNVDDAHAPKHIAWGHIIPLKEVLKHESRIDITDEQLKALSFGQMIDVQIEGECIAWHSDLPVALVVPRDGKTKARKVF